MIHLAYPYVTDTMRQAAFDTLGSRFIGQGPKVDQFEREFQSVLKTDTPVAVGSGTDALHLAYLLAGIGEGDEVLVPNFTCTATNMPLLWLKAKLVFVDVDPGTLNISVDDIKKKITKDTKAIVTVDYAGQPCDYDKLKEFGVTIIDDAAHAPGASYRGKAIGSIADYTTFSFQAIKHITTGDGGIVTVPKRQVHLAKLLRWFGIDRERKLENMSHWQGDIEHVGYKYQMTDIAASLGIESLKLLNQQIKIRRLMVQKYRYGLKDLEEIRLLEDKPYCDSAYWLMTVLAEDRDNLRDFLIKREIESSPFHYRNDKYSIFSQYKNDCPNMDAVENKILCLPLHMKLELEDIDTVIQAIHDYYRKN